MAYKKDQGRMVRMAAFWSVAILFFYGCISLYRELSSHFPGALAVPIGGIHIPIIGVDLSGAFLIATVVFLGGAVLLVRLFEKPKNADLLIETEAELRKVTWPTLDEAINGSFVVIVCVVFLMAFLAGADWVLGKWAHLLFYR